MIVTLEELGAQEKRKQISTLCWDCCKARAFLCPFHNASLDWEERLAFPKKIIARLIIPANKKEEFPLYTVVECDSFLRDETRIDGNKEKPSKKKKETKKAKKAAVTTMTAVTTMKQPSKVPKEGRG